MRSRRPLVSLCTSIALAMTLAACGGGGGGAPAGDAGPPPASPLPTASITYPTPLSQTDEPLLRVRGTTTHSRAIDEVLVNGVAAMSNDGFATWQAWVPIADRLTELRVSVQDDAGATNPDAASATVHRGTTLSHSPAIAPTPSGAGVYVFDPLANALVHLEIATAAQSVLSGPCRGRGPSWRTVSAMALDEPRERLLVVDPLLDAVFAVHLETGDRSVLSSNAVGPGLVGLDGPTSIAIDVLTARGWVVDSGSDSIIALDLLSGGRERLSGSGVGGGPELQEAAAVAHDRTSDDLFVTDVETDTIVRIDTTTGDRTPFGNGDAGFGPAIARPGRLAVDAARGQVIVNDRQAGVLVAVDIGTGVRRVLPDVGGNNHDPFAFTVDAERARTLIVDRGMLWIYVLDLSTETGFVVRWDVLGGGHDWRWPTEITLDPQGGRLFAVSDLGAALVEIDATSGQRRLVTGGAPGGLALADVAYDPVADRLYTADALSGSVLAITPSNGQQSVLSGPGAGAGTPFEKPVGIVLDAGANRLLVVDETLAAVFAVDLATGDRTILSGEPSGSGPALDRPSDILLDANAGLAYVADETLAAIVSVDLATGTRTILTGNGVGRGAPDLADNARLSLALDGERGQLLVAGADDRAVIAVDLETGARRLLLDRDFGLGPRIEGTLHLAYDPSTQTLFVTDASHATLLAVDLVDDAGPGDRRPVSAAGMGGGPVLETPSDLAVSPDGATLYVLETDAESIVRVDASTGDRLLLTGSGAGSGIALGSVRDLAVHPDGGSLLLVDSSQDAVIAVDVETGARTLVSGDTRGSGPSLALPRGLAVAADGATAYVVDTLQDALVAVDLATGNRTIVSDPSVGFGTPLQLPMAVVLDVEHGPARALVLDAGLDAVVAIDLASGTRSILSDNSLAYAGPPLAGLGHLALVPGSCFVLYTDDVDQRLVAIHLATGERTVVSGDDLGEGRRFEDEQLGVAFDPVRGLAYVADEGRKAVLTVDLGTIQRVIVSRSRLASSAY